MSKSFAVVFTAVLGSALAPAHAENWEFKETLVHAASHSREIALNAGTVLCSAADYGKPFLKVLIPELAAITLLDHQNIGAGAPCVAAGTCTTGKEPETILDPAKPTEPVTITVQAFRQDSIEHDAQTCTTFLLERVQVTIRGTAFTHERFAALGSRPYADCL